MIAGDLLLYQWTTSIGWTSGFQLAGGYSVLNLLVVLAGFFLLITGQYPAPSSTCSSASTAGSTASSTSPRCATNTRHSVSIRASNEPGDVEAERPTTTPALIRTPA